MHYDGGLTPDELDEQIVRSLDQVRQSADSMPVFGVAGWSGAVSLGEWIYEGGPHSLLHGDPDAHASSVQVQTVTTDARTAVYELRLRFDGPWEGDDFGARYDDYATAPHEVMEIEVDGAPLAFERWTVGPVSWLAGTLGEFGIAIEARSVAPGDLELTRVTDLEPYIAGRLEWIRRFRA